MMIDLFWSVFLLEMEKTEKDTDIYVKNAKKAVMIKMNTEKYVLIDYNMFKF